MAEVLPGWVVMFLNWAKMKCLFQ